MKIAVGSGNPVKIAATKEAFEKIFPGTTWIVEGIEVDSEVPRQPMSDNESITGARNRANKAIKQLHGDYGVGIEAGLQQIGGAWFTSGWMVVVDKNNKEGIGSSLKMNTPESIMELIRRGKELGQASDAIFKETNSKHKQGYFGLMTNNAITGKAGYRDGIISALARFLNPQLFEK